MAIKGDGHIGGLRIEEGGLNLLHTMNHLKIYG